MNFSSSQGDTSGSTWKPEDSDGQSAPLTGVDLSGYMNPYTQQVIGSTLSDLGRIQAAVDAQLPVTRPPNLPFVAA